MSNYSGSILWKDVVIADFEVSDGSMVKWFLHEDAKQFYPLCFRWHNTPSGWLQLFLVNRLVSDKHQDIDFVLNQLDLSEYSWEDILRANHGLNPKDYYWVREVGEDISYRDISIRRLFGGHCER